MKTPFYIIKRPPVNKETAEILANSLAGNSDPCRKNLQDLIDFFPSGGTAEKVFIEPGMRVRIKSMPVGAFIYHSPGVGAVCELTSVCFYVGSGEFMLNTDNDYNCLHIHGDNLDLSEYLELV
jgi:hypothetical protein